MKYSIGQTVKDLYNDKAFLTIQGFGHDLQGQMEYLCSKSDRELYGWILENELVPT